MWNKVINFNHFIHGGNNNICLYCSAANSVAVLTFSFSINVRNNTMLTAESKGSNAPSRETDDGQKDPKTEVGESTDGVSILCFIQCSSIVGWTDQVYAENRRAGTVKTFMCS